MTPRHAFLFCSSHQQPCLCLGPLEDLFEVKLRPSRALSLPSFWNYRETMTQSGMLQQARRSQAQQAFNQETSLGDSETRKRCFGMLTEKKEGGKNPERKVLCGAAVLTVFIFMFCRRKQSRVTQLFSLCARKERKKLAFVSVKTSQQWLGMVPGQRQKQLTKTSIVAHLFVVP